VRFAHSAAVSDISDSNADIEGVSANDRKL
jgi:hypothetical protein